MGTHVKMKNPATGKTEIVTPQNALDLEQHLGWRRVGHVKVKDNYTANPQDVLDNPRKRANAAQASVEPDDDIVEEVVDSLDEVTDDPDDDDSEKEPSDAEASIESAVKTGR